MLLTETGEYGLALEAGVRSKRLYAVGSIDMRRWIEPTPYHECRMVKAEKSTSMLLHALKDHNCAVEDRCRGTAV